MILLVFECKVPLICQVRDRWSVDLASHLSWKEWIKAIGLSASFAHHRVAILTKQLSNLIWESTRSLPEICVNLQLQKDASVQA